MAAQDLTFDDGQTVAVRGEGGHEFIQDVPPTGTQRREHFDEMIAKGLLAVIDLDPTVDADGLWVRPDPEAPVRRGRSKATPAADPEAPEA